MVRLWDLLSERQIWPYRYYHVDFIHDVQLLRCCIFYSLVLLVVEVFMKDVLDRLDKLT